MGFLAFVLVAAALGFFGYHMVRELKHLNRSLDEVLLGPAELRQQPVQAHPPQPAMYQAWTQQEQPLPQPVAQPMPQEHTDFWRQAS